MKPTYDLLGIGIGPFNLSLAALLAGASQSQFRFFDSKPSFSWHPELMYDDSIMQTTYLKDLVTPADPTSPYSFLNYLHHKGLFYQFLNTQRSVVSRKEFEAYCKWVSHCLEDKLNFSSEIQSVSYDGESFCIQTNQNQTYQSKSISVATGKRPFVPSPCQNFLGKDVFHIKQKKMQEMELSNKRVVIVGGGQTGLEVFKNALENKWGKPQSLHLVSRRNNLEPLDETAFTNEYFNPNYVNEFWPLDQKNKDKIVQEQKLSSDGNTPDYLLDVYRLLYKLKNINEDSRAIEILPMRELRSLRKNNGGFYKLSLQNKFNLSEDFLEADLIILCTGFKTQAPQILEPLYSQIDFDKKGRLQFNKNYSLKWKGSAQNKIYVLNFSRHSHGIVDPQTSLMAWRSAQVVNDLYEKEVYHLNHLKPSFIRYSQVEDLNKNEDLSGSNALNFRNNSEADYDI